MTNRILYTTNPKSKKVTLAVGKTKTVKSRAIQGSKSVSVHRKLKFESSNPAVAKVGANTGKIRAVKKGTCYIYVYAQSGQFAKIKVTVK